MSKTTSAILILSLLLGTNPLYASTQNCKDGKCVASFVKKKQDSKKEDIRPMMTAFNNKKKENLHQPFVNLQPVDSFISTDSSQNSIILDDQPLLSNLSPFVEEIDNIIDAEKAIEEDKRIIVLLDKKPVIIQYECTNEQEAIVCDTEFHECKCV